MNPHLQRATVLIQQERWELAEEQIRLSLASQPDDSYAHALLAICLTERKQYDAAEAEARQAVHLGPAEDFSHYAHARLLFERNRFKEAAAAIEQAIQCNPTDADYHGLLAAIHFNEKRWQECLTTTENGLQFDPEHIGCNNLRAMALVKLGRRVEAGLTIDAALQRNPDNSDTHANRGWALLESGDRRKALEHFKEALRLEPTNDWARAGIVEALKAANPAYSLALRYFFWMSRLSTRTQWIVVVGGYLGNRILSDVRRSHPNLAPWILPVQIAYIAFALLTWLADPLCNLLLRLNRYGRLALSEEQTTASNWVGGCLLFSLLGVGIWAISGFQFLYLLGAIVSFGLALPVAAIWKCREGWPRKVMAIFATGMGVLAAAILLAVVGGSAELAMSLLSAFGIGFIACPWLTNALVVARPRR